ncbi:MAG: hypothetical protein U0X20_17060 [Caldilineaceae bacterium]
MALDSQTTYNVEIVASCLYGYRVTASSLQEAHALALAEHADDPAKPAISLTGETMITWNDADGRNSYYGAMTDSTSDADLAKDTVTFPLEK